MKKTISILGLFLAAVAGITGCGGDSEASKFCKGPDGTAQDCAIACKVDKGPEVCKLYETKTAALCDKAGKAACQEICDKDKNEHACAHVKTMK